jgi:hypothetical protein
MSNAEQNPLDIHLRFAALERRITKLEAGLQEMDRIVDPEGWIGEAFNVLESHLDQRLDRIDQRFDSMDSKLDTIMRHLNLRGAPAIAYPLGGEGDRSAD